MTIIWNQKIINIPPLFNRFVPKTDEDITFQLAWLHWMLAGNINGDSSDNFHLNDFASRKYLELFEFLFATSYSIQNVKIIKNSDENLVLIVL